MSDCNTHPVNSEDNDPSISPHLDSGNDVSGSDTSSSTGPQSLHQISSDEALALSINNAIALDQHIITAMMNEESMAQQDHALAVLLGENPEADIPNANATVPPPHSDLNTHFICETMNNLGLASESQDNQNIHPSQDSRTDGAKQQDYQCVGCMENLTGPPMHWSACSHKWCGRCLRALFLNATTDEELYPPRCCGNIISRSLATRLLDYKELTEFGAKGVEYSTHPRIYCGNQMCSTFIPPCLISEETGRCPACHLSTHTTCRTLGEPGHECPPDEAEQQVLALARQEGWRACPQCGIMVELSRGCNHMTCR